MGLPWVRLDTNIWSHDKTVSLLERPSGYRAFTLYIFGLTYSAGHETDGLISKGALRLLSGTTAHADALVDVGLWEHVEGGAYQICNYAERQPMKSQTEVKSEGAKRAICKRWMDEGKACSCGGH